MSKVNKHLQFIIIVSCILFSDISAGAETLYVFFPSFMPAASVQKMLTDACPKITVMVFGRFKDFEDRVKNDMPDAVLTKQPLIEYVRGYAVSMQGIRAGSSEESYVFLSINRTIDIKGLSGKSVGVFDILGRKGMNEFIGKYLKPLPSLKRVSKMEDMLQMLTFNMVEGILIPDVYVDDYKKMSERNFIITPFPAMKTGILALGVAQGRKSDVFIKSLSALDKQYMDMLEVEQWK